MVIAARLRRSADIARVRTDGLVRGGPLFTIGAHPNAVGMIRLAVSTQRGVGGAVARNRARRRLREAVRVDLRERASMPSIDLVLVARRALGAAKGPLVRADVARALDLVGRTGP